MTAIKEESALVRAETVRDRVIKALTDSITGHHKNFDALALAIELFGDDPDTTFGLESYQASVFLYASDVNATLKRIHHAMRTAGWGPPAAFNKEHMSWHWKESVAVGCAAISFYLFLRDDATCRKVQVGTKEEPVYEIQCDDNGATFDIEEPVDDAPAVAVEAVG